MTEPEIVQLPRSIHVFPKMTSMSTKCITATDPIGFPIDEPCKIDKIDLNGGTLRWSVICTKPPATATLEWIEHYHGETMDGQVNNRTTLFRRRSCEKVAPAGQFETGDGVSVTCRP